MSPWSAHIGPIEVCFGPGCIRELGRLAREVLQNAEPDAEHKAEGGHVLLVTDSGVRQAGHAGMAEQALAERGFEILVYDRVSENPTSDEVETGRGFVLEAQERAGRAIDLIVAVGGGSAMDCAKGINFVLTNGGRIEDYWGRGKAQKPMLPSIGAPTTAGTGSEAQSFALISRASDRVKMACGDPKARFHAVVLDPELLDTVPPRVTALAGLDAISHAIESYVSTAANPMSRLLAREAWVRLERSFEPFVRARRAGETDSESAADLLLGAHLAGAAIEQSMLGAAHALANPLTARHGVPHGAAVLLTLPWVVRFNGEIARVRDDYRDLAQVVTGEGRGDLARHIETLRDVGELPTSLAELGIPQDELPRLAHDAAEQWTARFNPRPVDEKELSRIYESAY